MVLHACGHTMYRTMDGVQHCPRCEQRDDTCPACNGDGYRLRGRLMSTCAICHGTGTTNARISGNPNEALTANSSSGAFVSERDYGSPAAGNSLTGRKHEFVSSQTGGRWYE